MSYYNKIEEAILESAESIVDHGDHMTAEIATLIKKFTTTMIIEEEEDTEEDLIDKYINFVSMNMISKLLQTRINLGIIIMGSASYNDFPESVQIKFEMEKCAKDLIKKLEHINPAEIFEKLDYMINFNMDSFSKYFFNKTGVFNISGIIKDTCKKIEDEYLLHRYNDEDISDDSRSCLIM